MLSGKRVSSSVVYDPATHTYNARRIAVLTNIGSLHATVSSPAITATIDEQAVDQGTASANAVAAAAQALQAMAAKTAP